MQFTEPLKLTFQRFFQIRYIYHYLFWISHILVIVITGWSVPKYMIVDWSAAQGIQLLMVIIMFYLNIRIFIPQYYRQNRFFTYIFLGLTIIFLSYLIYACYIQWFTNMPYDMFQWDQISEVLVKMSRLFLTSFFLGLTDDWVAQQKRLSDMKVEKLRAELNYLRSQINPHFLFNTLNNLYGLALEKSDKTPMYILKLSEMMDYMLFESNEEKVALSEDLKNLTHYIDIERIRHIEPSKITFDTEGVLDDKNIAPLLLLPLVENAFKHGLNGSMTDAFVKIRIQVIENNLDCWVSNNINSDFNADEIEKNHGIGLHNLHKRLDLFYPNKHTLSTSKSDTSFQVHLKLNLA